MAARAKSTASARPARARALTGPPNAFVQSRSHDLAGIANADGRRAASGCVLELAWEGQRVMACRAGDDVRLVSVQLREWGATFPSIGAALKQLSTEHIVLDGFVCALDERGRPSFERLRAHVAGSPQRIVLAVWDLLHVDGEDLRPRPLLERRERLAALLREAPDALVFSQSLTGELSSLLVEVSRLGVPGVFARGEREPYPTKESTSWSAIACGDEPIVLHRTLSPRPAVTNADKVLFPRDGITKRRIVDYYAAIAPVLLPHLEARPVVCQRWPDGIDDFTWYQHRPPPRAPDYLRSVRIDDDRRMLLANADALLWMVNQAALTFHSWTSRVDSLTEPDWVLFDLDPGEATTWAQTIEVALALRRLLDLLELPSVVKTSGQRGLHVLVPIGAGHTTADAHRFAECAAVLVGRLMPGVVTLESERAARGGRLFLDHQQSFVGKTLVAPYSLRAADGAPVSTPLDWSEVGPRLDPTALHIRTLLRRVEERGDLAAPLLSGTVSLAPALRRLQTSL